MPNCYTWSWWGADQCNLFDSVTVSTHNHCALKHGAADSASTTTAGVFSWHQFSFAHSSLSFHVYINLSWMMRH